MYTVDISNILRWSLYSFTDGLFFDVHWTDIQRDIFKIYQHIWFTMAHALQV